MSVKTHQDWVFLWITFSIISDFSNFDCKRKLFFSLPENRYFTGSTVNFSSSRLIQKLGTFLLEHSSHAAGKNQIKHFLNSFHKSFQGYLCSVDSFYINLQKVVLAVWFPFFILVAISQINTPKVTAVTTMRFSGVQMTIFLDPGLSSATLGTQRLPFTVTPLNR